MALRKFMVMTEPNVADPAYMCPVIDMTRPEDIRQYTDETELMKVAMEVHDKILEQTVRNRTIVEVLELFGLTYDDYIKALKAR